MKLIRIFTIITAIYLFSVSCNRLNPFSDEVVVARVGEARLYESDVKTLFSSGMDPQDSLKLLESYVDVWVKKQLKIQEAEKMFGKDNADIERMVEDYRSSLLSNKLDHYYVDMRLDTLYTDEAVSEYYNSHKSDFVLDRPIVKGRVVKMPEKDRQKKKLTELIAGSGDRLQDLRDMCYKNKFELTEFNTWTELGDFQAALPVNKSSAYDELFAKKGVVELKDNESVYLVYLTDKLNKGDAVPLDRVVDVIKRILLNQRRQDIIRSYEDSLYKTAVDNRKVDVKYEAGRGR